MKTRCELTEKELRKLLKVKRLNINFPKETNKLLLISTICLIIGIFATGILSHKIGYNDGMTRGLDEGYTEGYNAQLDPSYEELTLKQAIAFNIKHNLDNYINWFGLVVGLGWVLHGVGFKLAG